MFLPSSPRVPPIEKLSKKGELEGEDLENQRSMPLPWGFRFFDLGRVSLVGVLERGR